MQRIQDLSQSREEQIALLASIVATSDDAIISKTLDGVITSWNVAAERLFGYSAHEAIGQHISLIIPTDRLDEERHIIERLKRGEQIDHFETVRRRKNGTQVSVSLTVSPLINSVGTIIGASKIVRDVTARKALDAELHRQVRALERSNKDLEDFAYIASHDLKEPLRGLANNAAFLREDLEGNLDQNAAKRLSRIVFLSNKMEKLIDNLLSFSRLSRCEFTLDTTDISKIAHNVVRDLDTSLRETNTSISISEALPRVMCDRLQIKEVLFHLIRNAIKYNDKSNKHIEIGCIDQKSVENSSNEILFYVRDNGIGIEGAFFEEIFRIFKRLNHEDDLNRGDGVGLTFVRKIITKHGGRIWIESCPGEGTTFFFTLIEGDVYAAAA